MTIFSDLCYKNNHTTLKMLALRCYCYNNVLLAMIKYQCHKRKCSLKIGRKKRRMNEKGLMMMRPFKNCHIFRYLNRSTASMTGTTFCWYRSSSVKEKQEFTFLINTQALKLFRQSYLMNGTWTTANMTTHFWNSWMILFYKAILFGSSQIYKEKNTKFYLFTITVTWTYLTKN